MKKLTTEYLQGVLDALYYSQTELIGAEIENEKDFNMSVIPTLFGFTIQLTYVESLEEAKYENDLHTPIYDTQKIFISEDAKVYKVVKDVITEMEKIYNKPLPEVAELVEKEYEGTN